MPTNSPNFNIPKPVASDVFNLTNFNGILDAIDTNVKTALDGKVSNTIPTVSGDLNTYTTTGFYHVPASVTNAPTTAIYELTVISNGTYVTQFAIGTNVTATLYQRKSMDNGSTWTPWTQVITATQLTGIPSSSTTVPISPSVFYNLGLIDSNYGFYNDGVTDLNSISTKTRFSYVTGTNANMPSGVSVQSYLIQYRIDASNFIQHLWTNEATPRYFMRTKTAGTWGSWTQVETTSGAQTKANTAESNAKTYSDTQLGTHTSDYVKHPGFGSTTGTANTYAITLSPAPTSYLDGMAVSVKINVDSTGASTLNVNGLGAKGLKKANGTDITNLKANGVYTFRYNSSTGNFIVQGEGGAGNAVASDLLTGKTASTDAGDITGTMANNGAVTITPGTTNQTIAAGYHNGSGVVNGDADLIASNIKSGVDIFGVVGNVTISSLGGKRYATGSALSSPTTTSFTDYTGASRSGYASFTVSGLPFTPSVISVSDSTGLSQSFVNTNTPSQSGYKLIGVFGSTYRFRLDGSSAYISGGSFSIPVDANNVTFTYHAWE
jgi:hypothetical protein